MQFPETILQFYLLRVHVNEQKQLCIADNQKLTQNGLKSLARLPKLEVLLIPGARFQTVWWNPLADVASLKQLVLSDATISDDNLVGITKLNELKALSLANTPITDRGVVHLLGLKTLKSINLTRTKISKRGFSELQKALPECEIIR